MKIKKLRYQNFRNYAKQGEISFSTDGKVTIIYGTNGDGKTTLHQLFQWILYGKVNFNQTTSGEKLYNLANGKRLFEDSDFKVWGEIDFEYMGDDYRIRREYTYHKNIGGRIQHVSSEDQFSMLKKNKINDWERVIDAEALVENILPSGLSTYFFFDGETMIADLKMRGKDSARSLKKAIYSIFDLEAYDLALRDIGDKNKSTSIIGSLDRKRLEELSKNQKVKSQQQDFERDIKILKKKIEECSNDLEKAINENSNFKRMVADISEKIGNNKSRYALERERQNYKDLIIREERKIEKVFLDFGKEIEENYAYLLISEVVKTASNRLYLQVENEEKNIIPGLTKELLINLLKDTEKQECICGRCIDEMAQKKIEKWKEFFPPASYKATYDKFRRNADKFCGRYDSKKLFSFIGEILEIKRSIRKLESDIENIDLELKNCGDIDDLIDKRKNMESAIKSLEKKIADDTSKKEYFEKQLELRTKKVEKSVIASDSANKYKLKLEIMDKVKELIEEEMRNSIMEYCDLLEMKIQELIDQMLTSKRKVELNNEFELRVLDSFEDESKSEGQFAVVSFAYIGAIFDVLKQHEKLENKEFPLVLDGPFSKLDQQQKNNVICTIPEYAPQVIILSKDPLEDFISKDKIGKIWTIVSNEEKNNAEIKEGYLWN